MVQKKYMRGTDGLKISSNMRPKLLACIGLLYTGEYNIGHCFTGGEISSLGVGRNLRQERLKVSIWNLAPCLVMFTVILVCIWLMGRMAPIKIMHSRYRQN